MADGHNMKVMCIHNGYVTASGVTGLVDTRSG